METSEFDFKVDQVDTPFQEIGLEYFIDLQCDFLSGLNSQLVAPLTPETNFIQASQTKHSYSDAS